MRIWGKEPSAVGGHDGSIIVQLVGTRSRTGEGRVVQRQELRWELLVL